MKPAQRRSPLLLCLALLAGCGSSDGGGERLDRAGAGGSRAGAAGRSSRPPPAASTPPRSTARPRPAWSRSARSSAAAPAPPRAPASSSTTDGEIVTNAHVVTDESQRQARSRPRKSSSSSPTATSSPAEIVGFDPFADVALLKIEPDGFALHPLELGDDADLQVGQPVAAIGSPFGEQQSLSSGIVSATDRSVKSLTQFQIEGAIQTDASINPGNSGGPLLDAGARVIGINQQIETNSGANDGVGFAVPVSAIKRSIAQLRGRRQRRIRLHRRLQPGALPAARRQARPRHRPSAACSPKSSPAARPRRPGSRAATRNSLPGRPNTAPAAT